MNKHLFTFPYEKSYSRSSNSIFLWDGNTIIFPLSHHQSIECSENLFKSSKICLDMAGSTINMSPTALFGSSVLILSFMYLMIFSSHSTLTGLGKAVHGKCPWWPYNPSLSLKCGPSLWVKCASHHRFLGGEWRRWAQTQLCVIYIRNTRGQLLGLWWHSNKPCWHSRGITTTRLNYKLMMTSRHTGKCQN